MKKRPIVRMNSGRVLASPCGHCGKMMDGVTRVACEGFGEGPRLKRTYSICCYCGELNYFGDDGRLVKVDAMDALNAELHPVIGPLFKAMRETWKLTRKPAVLTGRIL